MLRILCTLLAIVTNALSLTSTETFIVPDGDATEIFCLHGVPNVTAVTWKAFGVVLNESINAYSTFNVSRNSSLIVTNNRKSSTQGLVDVSCVANFTNGTFREILYQVVLHKASRIINTKFSYDVPDDGSVEINLVCNGTGFPKPDIKWSFRKSELPANETYFVNTSQTVNLTAFEDGRLHVFSRQRERGFGVNLTCNTNNTDGMDMRSFMVRFLKVAKILNPRYDIVLPVVNGRRDLVIPCQVTGYPAPTVYWEFGGKRLDVGKSSEGAVVVHGDIKQPVSSSVTYEVFVNGSLIIRNIITKEHVEHENFTCVAENIAGKDRRTHDFYIGGIKSYTFVVTLKNAGNFSEGKSNIVNQIKSAFQSDNKTYYSINITRVNLTSASVQFVLSWREEKLEMYKKPLGRDFPSLAKDVASRLQAFGVDIMELIMDAEPGPPTSLSAMDVTSSTITFNWKPPAHFIVTKYQIQINYGDGVFKHFDTASGDTTTAMLDNLDSGSEYIIRMLSENKNGVGKFPSETLLVKTDDAPPVTIIVVVVVLVVLVVAAVALGALYYHRRQKRADGIISLADINPYEFAIPGVAANNIYFRDNRTFCARGSAQVEDEIDLFSWREIARDSLTLGDTLGQGEFGIVARALWYDEEKNMDIPVAVKTIKENATETDRKELFKELKLMADVSNHPNVVNLIGACSKSGPLWIIVELCEHGNLLGYLRKNREEDSERTGGFVTTLDQVSRVRVAHDVSKGMHYLQDKKVVHRDLAARNVLLGKNKVAKISDFGLSRDIYEVGLYQKNTAGKLPVRWMAIESIQEATYTSKSDVWSFGVLLWEIETAGVVPYAGVGGRDLIALLLNGFRLERPRETTFEIYDLMKKCWEPNPKARPNFAEIESELEAYLEQRSDYLPVLMEEANDKDSAYTNYYMVLEDEETATS